MTETENDASVGTSDSSLGYATQECELRLLPTSYASSESRTRAGSARVGQHGPSLEETRRLYGSLVESEAGWNSCGLLMPCPSGRERRLFSIKRMVCVVTLSARNTSKLSPPSALVPRACGPNRLGLAHCCPHGGSRHPRRSKR